MKLTIKTLQGTQFEIDVDAGATVAALKTAIEGEKGATFAVKELIFVGKILDDGGSLADAKVVDGSFLVCTSTLPEPKEAPLPEGWESRRSRSTDEAFYHHSASGATQWERPAHPVAPPSTRRRRRRSESPDAEEVVRNPSKRGRHGAGGLSVAGGTAGAGAAAEATSAAPAAAAAAAAAAVESSRSVVCYLGPTNSGKTYESLQFLASRGSGAYAGPLRLLALEVCNKLRRELGHDKVGCVTGEEEDNAAADVLCCTAECAPDGGDTLVLDEVHWLVNEDRGHAWTRLLVLADRWRHVRICGPIEAEPLLRKVFAERAAGVTFEVRRTARLSRLVFGGEWSAPLAQLVTPGCGRTVAIVAFTKAAVLGVAYIVKRQHGLRVAALYGAQPPETRVEILRQVSAGEVDVVVTTDVIGHGINLPLDAVLFVSTSKWDGRRLRPLAVWELAQIAGRAGRGADRPGAVYALRLAELPDERPSLPLIERGAAVANGDRDAPTDLVVQRGRLRPSLKELRLLGAGAGPPRAYIVPGHEDDDDDDDEDDDDYADSRFRDHGDCGDYGDYSDEEGRQDCRRPRPPPHDFTQGLAAALREWGNTSTAARNWSASMRTWCTPIDTDKMFDRILALPPVHDAEMLDTAWSLALLPVNKIESIAYAVLHEQHVSVPADRARAAEGEELENALQTLGDIMAAARHFPQILPPQHRPLRRIEDLYLEGSARLASALQSRIDAGGLCPRCNRERQNLRHRLCQGCFGR